MEYFDTQSILVEYLSYVVTYNKFTDSILIVIWHDDVYWDFGVVTCQTKFISITYENMT